MTTQQTMEPTPRSGPRFLVIVLTVLFLGIICLSLAALVFLVVLRPTQESEPEAFESIGESRPLSTVPPVEVTPVTFDIPGTESNIYVEYILDASGSMKGQLQDGTIKQEAAREVLTARIESFPPEAHIGLRAYGHNLDWQGQEEESCQDIELIAPVETGQVERIASWLQSADARGMTPLANSIRMALDDFVDDPDRVNSIVMISDGIDTCDGNPCMLVEEAKAGGVNFKMHVIGMDVDAETRTQLECIARASEGIYRDARSAKELNQSLAAVEQQVATDHAAKQAELGVVATEEPEEPVKDETAVPTVMPTNTPLPPTATSTATPVPPTPTPTPLPPSPTPTEGIPPVVLATPVPAGPNATNFVVVNEFHLTQDLFIDGVAVIRVPSGERRSTRIWKGTHQLDACFPGNSPPCGDEGVQTFDIQTDTWTYTIYAD
jgi:hypothetical protein